MATATYTLPQKQLGIPAGAMETGQYGIIVSHTESKYLGLILHAIYPNRLMVVGDGNITWTLDYGVNDSFRVEILPPGTVITITV